MAEVLLQYEAPVYVEVDTTELRVLRVVVGDDALEFDKLRNEQRFSLQGWNRLDVDKAHEIAEEVEWPAWEFGW